MLPSKLLANVLGITFVAVGILGFIPNPLVSPDGLFAVNAMHNIVHVLTGFVFLAGARMGASRNTVLGVGVAYVVVTIAGFLTPEGSMLLGLVHINEADRWLHLGLAIAILGGGFLATRDNAGAAAA